MRRALCLMCLLLLAPAVWAAPAVPAAIQARYDGLCQAWNRRDDKAILGFFTDDVQFLDAQGKPAITLKDLKIMLSTLHTWQGVENVVEKLDCVSATPEKVVVRAVTRRTRIKDGNRDTRRRTLLDTWVLRGQTWMCCQQQQVE